MSAHLGLVVQRRGIPTKGASRQFGGGKASDISVIFVLVILEHLLSYGFNEVFAICVAAPAVLWHDIAACRRWISVRAARDVCLSEFLPGFAMRRVDFVFPVLVVPQPVGG